MSGICSEFSCCGMRTEQTWHAWLHFHQTLTPEATRGCLRVDHQGKDEKPRTASDMLLFAEHNISKTAPHVPFDQLVPLNAFTLADVRAEGGDIPIRIRVPNGSVIKNIAPLLDALICEAYADMDFIQTKHLNLRHRILQHRKDASPNVVFPEGMDESAFYRMTDEAFVTFHLMYDKVYSDTLPVTIMALRRASPDMDPHVLMQIERDKKRRA